MLERDLTSQDGLIAKSLPKDWIWTRIPDLPHKKRGRIGFDGVLWHGQNAWPVEVKLREAKLNEKELEMRDKFNEVGIKYIVLRYFEEDPNAWIAEGIDDKPFYPNVVSGNMEYICLTLERRTRC